MHAAIAFAALAAADYGPAPRMPGDGHRRAAARLTAQRAWQAEFYRDAEVPLEPSRQVRRRAIRKAAKAEAKRYGIDAIRTRRA